MGTLVTEALGAAIPYIMSAATNTAIKLCERQHIRQDMVRIVLGEQEQGTRLIAILDYEVQLDH